MEPKLYYIQGTRQCVGNSALWWREGGHGYTCDLKQAWKVPLDKAKSYRETDVPRLCSAMDALAETHVDVQYIRAYKEGVPIGTQG